MTAKQPTPQAISALLRKAGFKRSARGDFDGYSVIGRLYHDKVYVFHASLGDPSETSTAVNQRKAQMLTKYAEAIRAAGYTATGPSAGDVAGLPMLTVTAGEG